MDENTDFGENAAFKEYQTGVRSQIKAPWLWIIIVAVVTAIVSLLTSIFASIALGNSWALNFVIGLYGIPAGFILAFRNKTTSFLVSFRYSSYSAIIFTIIFFLFGFILKMTTATTIGTIIGGIGGLLLTSLIIGLYCCFSFGLGALLGTITHGVKDAKR